MAPSGIDPEFDHRTALTQELDLVDPAVMPTIELDLQHAAGRIGAHLVEHRLQRQDFAGFKRLPRPIVIFGVVGKRRRRQSEKQGEQRHEPSAS